MKTSVYEPELAHEQPIIYQPGTGSTLGGGFGTVPAWVSSCGAITHPVASGASFLQSFRRTRFTSTVGLGSNQELGMHCAALEAACAHRGNASQRGGFYFSCRFSINAIPNNTVRLFCGLCASLTAMCQFTGTPNDCIGLWTDEAQSGNFRVISKDTSTTNQTNFATPRLITAGILYEWVMFCNPNQSVVVTNLLDVTAGTLLSTQNVSLHLPTNTTMMAPQVGFCNVTNNAGGDCAMDVMSLYLRPNLKLTQSGTP